MSSSTSNDAAPASKEQTSTGDDTRPEMSAKTMSEEKAPVSSAATAPEALPQSSAKESASVSNDVAAKEPPSKPQGKKSRQHWKRVDKKKTKAAAGPSASVTSGSKAVKDMPITEDPIKKANTSSPVAEAQKNSKVATNTQAGGEKQKGTGKGKAVAEEPKEAKPTSFLDVLPNRKSGKLFGLTPVQRRGLLTHNKEVPYAAVVIKQGEKQTVIPNIPMALLARLSDKALEKLVTGNPVVDFKWPDVPEAPEIFKYIIAWAKKQCQEKDVWNIKQPESFRNKMVLYAVAESLGISEIVIGCHRIFGKLSWMQQGGFEFPSMAEISAVVEVMPIKHWTVDILAGKVAWAFRNNVVPDVDALQSFLENHPEFHDKTWEKEKKWADARDVKRASAKKAQVERDFPPLPSAKK